MPNNKAQRWNAKITSQKSKVTDKILKGQMLNGPRYLKSLKLMNTFKSFKF